MGWLVIPIAALTAALLTPVVIRGLHRFGVIDVPGARSSHHRPIPRGGGLAVVAATAVGLVAGWQLTGAGNRALMIGAVGFATIGFADDVRPRSARARLAAQFTVAATVTAVILAEVELHGTTLILCAAIGVIGTVGFVNAFNFMDGINGISVAQAAVAGLAWAAVGAVTGVDQLVVGGAALTGAALGFAPFNVPIARVFLGDVGSYFLGAYMAGLAMIGLSYGIAPEAIVAPMLVYILDTGTTLLWRVRNGEQWDQPHRLHVYQRLTDAGWSHVQTSAFVAAIMALCALLGALASQGPTQARIVADVGLALAIFAYLDWPDTHRGTARRGSTAAS